MIKKDIDKLPSDVRAQYKRFKVMHAEKKIQRKAKDDFMSFTKAVWPEFIDCLLYTSPSPRDRQKSRMPSSA